MLANTGYVGLLWFFILKNMKSYFTAVFICIFSRLNMFSTFACTYLPCMQFFSEVPLEDFCQFLSGRFILELLNFFVQYIYILCQIHLTADILPQVVVYLFIYIFFLPFSNFIHFIFYRFIVLVKIMVITWKC